MKNTNAIPAVIAALLGCGIMMDASGAAPSYVKRLVSSAESKLLSSDQLKSILENKFDPKTGVLDASNIWLQDRDNFAGVDALIEFLKEHDVKILELTNNRLGKRGMLKFCKEIPADRLLLLTQIKCHGNRIGPDGAIELLKVFSKTGKHIKIVLEKLEFWANDDREEKQLREFINSSDFNEHSNVELWWDGKDMKATTEPEAKAKEKLLSSDQLKSILENKFDPKTGVLDASNILLQDGDNFAGVQALGEFWKEHSIKSLILRNNRLGGLGMRELCGIIKGLPKDKQQELESITCDGNWIGNLSTILLKIANDDMALPKSGKRVIKLDRLGLLSEQEKRFHDFLDSNELLNLELWVHGENVTGLEAKAKEKLLSSDQVKIILKNRFDSKTGKLDASDILLQDGDNFAGVDALIEFLKEHDVKILELTNNRLGKRGMLKFCKEIPADRLLLLTQIKCHGNWIRSDGAIELLKVANRIPVPKSGKHVMLTLEDLGFLEEDVKLFQDFLDSNELLNLELWVDGSYKTMVNPVSKKDEPEATKLAQSVESAKPEGESVVIHIKNEEDASKMEGQTLEAKTSLNVLFENNFFGVKALGSVANFCVLLNKNKDMIASLELKLFEACNDLMLRMLGNALNKGTYPVKIHTSTDVERTNAEKVKAKCPRVEIVE